ncbi:MAG: hypothetical protein ABR606_09520 [Vicinamibacterales bacterium]
MTTGPATQDPELTKALIANATAQAEYYRQQVANAGRGSLPTWIPTVVSGVFAIVSVLLSVLISNTVTQRKADREQQRVYARQKTQLRLSVADFRAALAKISDAEPFPPAFLHEELIYTQPPRPVSGSRSDPYYLKYDLVDTIYRLCALLGWMELYRRDPSFLSGPPAERSAIEVEFAEIRRALAEELSAGGTAPAASDGFILEDDQRAIGEQMLHRRGPTLVIGYAQFCERLFRIPTRGNPTDASNVWSQNYWVWNATRFIVDMGKYSTPDVAKRRIRHVLDALARLARVLAN